MMKIRITRTMKVTMTDEDFGTIMNALADSEREGTFESQRIAAGEMRRFLSSVVEPGFTSDDPYMNAGNAANAGYEGTKLGKR